MNTKHKMKVLLPILAVVGLTMSGAAFASDHGIGGWGHPPHEGMQKGDRMEMIADKLDLNKKQRQQIKEIHRQSRTEMLELRDAMHDNREAMRELDPAENGFLNRADALAEDQGRLVTKQIKLRNHVRAKVASVLTPEQQEQAQSMQKKHRHERGGNWRRDG